MCMMSHTGQIERKELLSSHTSWKLMLTIRTQPVIDSIFAKKLNTNHTRIEIRRTIVLPILFWNGFIHPVCPTFGAVPHLGDVFVVHLHKLHHVIINSYLKFRSFLLNGFIKCGINIKLIVLLSCLVHQVPPKQQIV